MFPVGKGQYLHHKAQPREILIPQFEWDAPNPSNLPFA